MDGGHKGATKENQRVGTRLVSPGSPPGHHSFIAWFTNYYVLW